MALDDIYHVKVHLEAPSSPASFGIYYQEQKIVDAAVGPNQSLAESFNAAHGGNIANLMSEEWQISGYEARKISGSPWPKYVDSANGRAGQRGPSALPANNAILVQMFQTLFPKTSNGRLYVPGISESDTDIGRLTSAFSTGPLQTFVDRIAASVQEVQGTGWWLPGVISVKVRDAAPPFKDWEGSFSELVGALGWPVIARQRRRQTRVIGAF